MDHIKIVHQIQVFTRCLNLHTDLKTLHQIEIFTPDSNLHTDFKSLHQIEIFPPNWNLYLKFKSSQEFNISDQIEIFNFSGQRLRFKLVLNLLPRLMALFRDNFIAMFCSFCCSQASESANFWSSCGKGGLLRPWASCTRSSFFLLFIFKRQRFGAMCSPLNNNRVG